MRLDSADGLAQIVFDRPERRNALTPDDVDEIETMLTRVASDGTRAVLMRAEGTTFSVGRDLGSISAEEDVAATLRRFNEVFLAWRQLPIPTVAVVQGHCLGLGAGFALAADLVIAGQSAAFGSPLGKLGATADCGFHWIAARTLGSQMAKDLVLTGRFINGAEAERRGLVARCLPDEDVQAEGARIALQLAHGPTVALAASTELVDRVCDGLGHAETLDAEAELLGLTFATDDFREGYAAFFEKREPRFTGS
jgi:2-(1,2-epoxy-1,2-dihydrophenyl)acetyl-CoA isomerase